ncbi:MAG: DUF4230 domain-containing protein [Eubacteriales bacterium]|nr:DUF4230 domain-containing protein [Eubacteriales bacterium]
MKKSGMFFSGFMVLIVIAAIASAFFIGFKIARDKQEPAIIAIMNIEGTIKDIGELATAEYGYTIAQTTDKPNMKVVGFEIPFTSSKVIYSYEGLIKAGIDFNKIEVTVNEANKTIFIELPDAEILSSEVDFDSLIVYDAKYNPFNVFTFSDMNLGLTALKEKAEESAITNGLLIRAADNAQSILKTTVMSFYDPGEYKIEFY